MRERLTDDALVLMASGSKPGSVGLDYDEALTALARELLSHRRVTPQTLTADQWRNSPARLAAHGVTAEPSAATTTAQEAEPVGWSPETNILPWCALTIDQMRAFESSTGEIQRMGLNGEWIATDTPLSQGLIYRIHPHPTQPSETVAAVERAFDEIRELNMSGRDENGHRWANSDLIDQTVTEGLVALRALKGGEANG